MHEIISSKQNPKIKYLIDFQKSSFRKEKGLFILEGLNESKKAIAANYEFISCFVCPELISEPEFKSLFNDHPIGNTYLVSQEVFRKIAYREDSGGIVSLVKSKPHNFEQIKLSESPLLLVIEGVEKPGNLGAMYRTADAAGIDAIVICDPKADLYNPNAIRASIGCVFQVPTLICETQTAIDWLNESGIRIFPTFLQAAIPYTEINFSEAAAIVMGTEASGITAAWVNAATQNIIIPMKGSTDSLNVSTSAAIVLFEAFRQRNFK
jgi:RNA methyltransferase, TrmH family